MLKVHNKCKSKCFEWINAMATNQRFKILMGHVVWILNILVSPKYWKIHIKTTTSSLSHEKPHLLLVPFLQQLHVAAPLAVSSSQGGAPMFRQVGRGGHTPALRVDPGINMVGDIATRNPTNWTHRETQLFTALQHLRRGEERIRVYNKQTLDKEHTIH